MPRHARAVAVGYPHHITQRGNNSEPVFFDDNDRLIYLEILRHYATENHVDIWAYCLMTNHIHILAAPQEPNSLSQGIGLTNLKYTKYFNRKYYRSGRIWQNRFYSSIVDTDTHLWAVARYIENNPVKAGITATVLDYRWSSVHHHVMGLVDSLLAKDAWLGKDDKENYRQFLAEDSPQTEAMISKATMGGRPICKPSNLMKFEELLGRIL
jgi:putative transposase